MLVFHPRLRSVRRLTPKVLADASGATSVVNWRSPERPLKVVTGATVLAAYGSPVTSKLTCSPWKAPVSLVLALPELLVSTSVPPTESALRDALWMTRIDTTLPC